MEEGTTCVEDTVSPAGVTQNSEISEQQQQQLDESKTETDISVNPENISSIKDEESEIKEDTDPNKDESGVVVDTAEQEPLTVFKQSLGEQDACETNEDARSLGDLDSLPAGDELALGAAGSDSGVEGCGRALSSGGGSRSCASSVVSCGSGCGSESSSLAGAPPLPRRRVNVNVPDPKRSSPIGSSTPRPATAPRGPNLATRERARSREKPTLPEKPRPLTPKPRIRPNGDLPNLVRESPALRAKPTKTSSARCRTPSSPCEEKRWPTNGPRLTPNPENTVTRSTSDKYATLPRRKRETDAEGSPKHETTPPTSRRPTVSRSASSRCAIKTRVRIYAERTSQTVLLGTDVEAALAGIVPNIETKLAVSRCERGVQASTRGAESARLSALQAECAELRARAAAADAQLRAERAARLAAIAQLDDNTRRLLELAGAAGADAGAEGCLHALGEQLRSAGELAARQRAEIDALRDHCNKLQIEWCTSRQRATAAEARLVEAERDAAEMHDFLAAETAALADSLRDADRQLVATNAELDKRRAECRQLVRLCEQRRQEALCWAARVRGGAAGAGRALLALSRRLQRLTRALLAAYGLPPDLLQPTVYHNDAFSRSDSGEAGTPEEEGRGGLLAAIARAVRAAPPIATSIAHAAAAHAAATPHDDDASDDNSADLLDSETEPCLVTDPDCVEDWWSGPEGADGIGISSGDELSPERDSVDFEKEVESGSESLRTLSAAIAHRQRCEAEEPERDVLMRRVLALDDTLSRLLGALRLAAAHHDKQHDATLLSALREKIDVTEKNVADVVVKKLAELDASKNMMEQYRQSVETLKNQLAHHDEEDDLDLIEEEAWSYGDVSRAECAGALCGAAAALRASRCARLAPLSARLQRLAAALAAPSAL
ncbi:microtubule-associated protein futsch isoform X1 [Bombyx mandarina]|uniref:Microtubule-associated protein futsch isoform X1 n=1 Tax=Bombyx mandarina TaxID=7092 RepID=A0A6J2K916_BOMMA|nr:microtubule-associated protein futsch isoform X1 [Bombyx mandarina]XP_028038094.1 microtubule-associated protein futsch isoform X1 [Bombyx mandarina]XP_028038095.1 microtubule-associated protein futsch isoform X1 [Bombyx mandarina]